MSHPKLAGRYVPHTSRNLQHVNKNNIDLNFENLMLDVEREEPGIFKLMHQTVLGDEPIATGSWTTKLFLETGGGQKTCGCLIFDGYAHNGGNLEDWYLASILEEDRTLHIFRHIAEFYTGIPDCTETSTADLASWLEATSIPDSFDAWCMLWTKENIARRVKGVVSNEGRVELRELFARVAG